MDNVKARDLLATIDVLQSLLETDKRNAAEADLQLIFFSSEWYCARYKAGLALGINGKDLNNQLASWLKMLAEEIELPKTRRVVIGTRFSGVEPDFPVDWIAGKPWPGGAHEGELVPIFKGEEETDYDHVERISKAKSDLKILSEILAAAVDL